MSIDIRNRWTNQVIYTADEANTIREAVILALKHGLDLTGARLTDARLTGARLTDARLTGADLTRARLTGADLTRARLTGADLTDADLTGADLTDADLTGADLTGADLTDARLTGADLTRARLTGADLTDARLTDADLTDADLTGADLTGADLTGADLTDARLTDARLTGIKEDLFELLSSVPREVAGLREHFVAGRINGSVYEGECACLVGTVANMRHCYYQSMPELRPDSSRPIERFTLAVRTGDTPETNAVSRLMVLWIDEWNAQQAVAAPDVLV